uniref:7TM GPCR serpentine receptor class x (Srx) domain-containing protein n=1 Tax=Panagrolaimus sp. PS1159 TaxID=55785 RepID=A0AC35FZ45_9BILA
MSNININYITNDTDFINVTSADNVSISLHGNLIAILVIFIVGVCGLIANIFSLNIIYKVPALHNCFGYLCFIHALGEAGILAIFVFWSTSLSFL